jgi:hypothetical protein
VSLPMRSPGVGLAEPPGEEVSAMPLLDCPCTPECPCDDCPPGCCQSRHEFGDVCLILPGDGLGSSLLAS